MSKKKILVLDNEAKTLSIARSLAKNFEVYTGAKIENKFKLPKVHAYSNFVKKRYFYSDPLRHPHQFVKDLLKILNNNNFDILIGTHEKNIVPIMHYREKFEEEVILAHPQNEILNKSFNKKETLKIAKKNGIPIPKTFFMDFDEPDNISSELSYPLVLKPQWTIYWDREMEKMERGEFRIIYSSQQLNRDFDELKQGTYPPIIQELVPGQGGGGLDVLTLLDTNQNLKALFMQKRLKEVGVYGGASAFWESIPIDNTLMMQSLKLLREMRWEGISMTEFKHDPRDGTPKLMEVNGRFWGTLPLAPACGIDFSKLFIDLILGNEIHTKKEYKFGKRMYHLEGLTFRLFDVLLKPMPSWINRKRELKEYFKALQYQDSVFLSTDIMPYFINWIGLGILSVDKIRRIIKEKSCFEKNY